MALIDWLRPRWPVFAFLASAALLAGAHAFERFGGLAPCPMCLDQRERHWAVLAVAATCFAALLFIKRAIAPRIAALALALAFGFAFAAAAHHVAVEQGWMIATCESDASLIGPVTFEGALEAPKCDEIAWSLFGISMAGYNALISLALMIASLVIAVAPQRRSVSS